MKCKYSFSGNQPDRSNVLRSPSILFISDMCDKWNTRCKVTKSLDMNGRFHKRSHQIPSLPVSALELRIPSKPKQNPKLYYLMWGETRAGLVFVKITIFSCCVQKIQIATPVFKELILFLDFFRGTTLNKLIWLVTRWTGKDSQYDHYDLSMFSGWPA